MGIDNSKRREKVVELPGVGALSPSFWVGDGICRMISIGLTQEV